MSFLPYKPLYTFEETKEYQRDKLKKRMKELDVYDFEYKTNEEYDDMIHDCDFISQSSKITYTSRLKYLRKKLSEKSTHAILTNPYVFGMKIIDLNSNMKSKDNSFTAIITYLSYTGLKGNYPKLFTLWYNTYMKVFRELRRLRENNIPTEKQTKSMIDWGDVIKIRDRLAYGSMEHLLLSIYTYVPPRRQMDYAKMRVYIDPEIEPIKDHNYFQLFNKRLSSPVMYVHEHKTARFSKGFLNKEIPIELCKIIGNSLKNNSREYMFLQKRSNNVHSVQTFTNYSNDTLKTIFKNKLFSVNTLRHSFATYIGGKTLTLDQRKRYAMKMGHSLSKSLEYVLFGGRKENSKGEESENT